MAHWSLFVDESGRFEDPTDDVAVGGILMPAPVTGLIAGRVMQELRAALPHVPPPPHRWLVEQHVAHLGWHALGDFKRVSAGRREAHVRAAALLQREAPDEWKLLLSKLPRIDDEPRSDLIRFLSRRLEALGGATEIRDEARDALARIVRAVARIGEPVPGMLPAVLVTAGEESLSSGGPDRYRSALRATLERAADAILAISGPGDHLLTPQLMRRPKSRLDLSGVEGLAEEAGIPRRRADASVTLLGPRFLDRYEDRTPGPPRPHPLPWPVICDWIAYTARRHVKRPDAWERVRAGIEGELELRASVGPGLPLVASVGPHSTGWVNARKAGTPFADARASTRRWSADQARLWMGTRW